MFRPTNPNDRHQTDMEYQERQKQRDEKKDDFPVIALNKSELSLLRKCDNDLAPKTERNHSEAIRLRDLDFIKIIAPDKQAGENIEYCSIRERGRNYLRYLDDKKESERRASWHDWKIAIFSALAGAAISEPLWAVIRWISNHFQAP